MAIVKMKHLRVLAMQEHREELLLKLQRLGTVEVSNVDKSELPQLSHPDSQALDLYKSQYQAGLSALEILNSYSKAKGSLFSPRPVVAERDLFNDGDRSKAWDLITQITSSKEEVSALGGEKTALLQKKDSLTPWQNLDLPLDSQSTATVTVQFGTLPTGTDVAALQGSISASTDLAELSMAGEGKDGVYALLTCYTSVFQDALDVLKTAGWSRSSFRGITGTAKENIREIDSRLEDIEKKLVQKEEAMARMGEYRPGIQKYLDGNKQLMIKEEAKTRLVDTENTFFLDGWVEADALGEVESLLSSFSAAYETSEPTEEDMPQVPVKLKNGKLSRSMNVVTEMYSLPAYNGVDPNPLMMPFFVFFYGMMMADMGYGLIMIIATQMVLSKGKPKGGMRDFFELFRMLGYSTFAFGAITGGFFGNFLEALLKTFDANSTFTWFWTPLFTPLEDTIDVLYASCAFGAVHIITGMAVSFSKKAKDGKIMDGIMDEGSWWLLFAGIAVGALGYGWVVAYCGVAALVLTQGRDKKGLGKVIGGVGSLYDITGYFGDILSYARLMALMLAGSVIAKVFNDLGVITGSPVAFLAISLAGNTLNFLLNLLGCFVHTLRLQCLEFFGKFYMDGGRAFKPLNMDTTYVDIQGQN